MQTRQAKVVPDHYEGIVNLLTSEYSSMSPVFQQIARFLLQNPNMVALESTNALAGKCGTHPSNFVRFAQSLGYSGFKELQTVFQTRLATAAPGFRERINALEGELSRNVSSGNLGYLRDLVVRDIATLQGLLDSISESSLSKAATLLSAAENIYIAGQLRSEPIASFLRYLLTMLRRRVVLLDPAGGLAQEISETMTERDVLVAISFRHYANEVVAITEVAATKGTPIIAISDSQLSPLAPHAHILFAIPEDEYTFSRSLAGPMCLVQCMSIATAALLQPGRDEPPRIPTVTGKAEERRNARTRARKGHA